MRLAPLEGRPLAPDQFSPIRWGPYLDRLAASGYNLLELSDPTGANGTGRDLLSHFVTLGRSAGERPAAERQRNLVGLRSLVALARGRGIGVVVTSGVPASGASTALTRAIRTLAEAVPALNAIGVRTGTDRVAARAATDGVRAAAGFRGALHLQARLPRAAADELAARLPGRLVLRLPLDDGELTRPYLALGDPPAPDRPWPAVLDLLAGLYLPLGFPPEPHSAAEALAAPEEHLYLPRRYALLWELGGPPGAAGLPWLDAIFARRAARFCAAGGALGFLVTSPAGPAVTPARMSSTPPGAPAAATAADPYWWWHRLWGNAGQDPDRADVEVAREFGRRFGVDPGDFIFGSLALLSRMSVSVNAVLADGAALPPKEPDLGPSPQDATPAADSPPPGRIEPAVVASLYLLTGVLAMSASADPVEAGDGRAPSPAAAAPDIAAVDPAQLAMLYLASGEWAIPAPMVAPGEPGPRAWDERGYASVDSWAESRLVGVPDGRPGPIELAHELAWYSMRIRGDLDTISLLRPRDAAEWDRLRAALLAGAHLADLYARTLSATAYRRLGEMTGDEMAGTIADSHLRGAREAAAAFWRVLPDGSRATVRAAPGSPSRTGTALPSTIGTPSAGEIRTASPLVIEPVALRGPAGVAAGSTSVSPTAAGAGATSPGSAAPVSGLPGGSSSGESEPPKAEPSLAIRHIPAQRGTPTRALRINATVSHGDRPTRVVLRCWLPGEEAASEMPMTVNYATQQFYAATVPGERLAEGILRYQIEAREEKEVRYWPGPHAEATWPVPVSADVEGPQLTTRHQAGRDGLVHLEVTATDPAGVERVVLHWRPLDGQSPWQSLVMRPENGVYRAQMALPRAGLAYCVEAHDRWGNARCAPEPRRETPYVLVTGQISPSPRPHAASGSASAGSRSGSGCRPAATPASASGSSSTPRCSISHSAKTRASARLPMPSARFLPVSARSCAWCWPRRSRRSSKSW